MVRRKVDVIIQIWYYTDMTYPFFVESAGKAKDGHKQSFYKCHCGNIFKALDSQVRMGLKKQCPTCSFKDGKKKNTKHGMRKSKTYSSWQSMKVRCLAKTNKDYPRWGGIGIKIYEPWIHDFMAFYNYMGDRPDNTSLDRIDNNKGYEPGNVRWASALVQGRNKKNRMFIMWHGKPSNASDIAKELGISRGAVYLRYKRGKLYEPS